MGFDYVFSFFRRWQGERESREQHWEHLLALFSILAADGLVLNLRWNSWTSIWQKTRVFCSMLMKSILKKGKMRVETKTKTLESEKTWVYAQKPRRKMLFKNSIIWEVRVRHHRTRLPWPPHLCRRCGPAASGQRPGDIGFSHSPLTAKHPNAVPIGTRILYGQLLPPFLPRDSSDHGLINYKDTTTKCRLYWCLIEFIDWRYSRSCWYFDPALWTIAL